MALHGPGVGLCGGGGCPTKLQNPVYPTFGGNIFGPLFSNILMVKNVPKNPKERVRKDTLACGRPLNPDLLDHHRLRNLFRPAPYSLHGHRLLDEVDEEVVGGGGVLAVCHGHLNAIDREVQT